MFGCFGKIIKTIVVILAVIGFVAIGGVTFFKDFFNKSFFKSDSVLQKASKIADFSNLDSEFELVSSAKLPKIGNYVYIRHGASSQKFYFLLTSNNNILTKDDFKSHKYEQKITDFIKNFKILNFENFEITGISNMNALNQKCSLC